jgi:glycerate 2-kinase
MATDLVPRAPSPCLLLEKIFLDVAAACDGQALVTAALMDLPPPSQPTSTLPAPAVLALGKAAGPMLAGLRQSWPAPPRGGARSRALVIAPAARPPNLADRPGGLDLDIDFIVGEHPHPGDGSVRAGVAARALVAGLIPGQPLLVLLSGGGSALACLPADGLSLSHKRAAVAAVAAAGAPIGELNTVRKHLSAIKGGRLGQLARGPVVVLALSDVVGDDPGTIASGPFSPDATTFGDALDVLGRRTFSMGPSKGPIPPAMVRVGQSPPLPTRLSVAAVATYLREGLQGRWPETPKPAARWDHIEYRVIAGPAHVTDAALRAIRCRGRRPEILTRNTTADVGALADMYVAEAHRIAAAGAAADSPIIVGNGEPTIDLSGLAAGQLPGQGGRASHLALLVARGLASIAAADRQLGFLAAGTDDRDGNTQASGALVDRTTWARALAAGLDPQAALDRFDSGTLLGALGCLVRGPGTSNLLDLHLLAAF